MKKSKQNKELVKQLKELILKGNAHVTLDDALKNITTKKLGVIPSKLPYSIWRLVEHLRISQRDILDFCRNPEYKSPKWPDGYWVKAKGPGSAAVWKSTLRQIKKDRADFIALLEVDHVDLYTPFAHGTGQNLLREALVIADHNSYHIGEIVAVRRLLGEWK